MAPSQFPDFGRRAKDLLSRDYSFGHKFTLQVPSSAGMGLTATGFQKDQIFVGDINTVYKRGNVAVDVKVDTYSNVSTKITVDELRGTRTALSFTIPDHKSGKFRRYISFAFPISGFGSTESAVQPLLAQVILAVSPIYWKSVRKPSLMSNWAEFVSSISSWGVFFSHNPLAPQDTSILDIHYVHPHAAINSSIGLSPAPLLEFNAAIGTLDLSLGGEVGFDAATGALTKYNTGICFNKPDFSATVALVDKGEALKASYCHVVDPSNAVAAEMTHRFSSYQNSFSIGSSHIVDPHTLLKSRFSNDGKVAVLCQREWRPKSHLTLSCEYDTKVSNSTRHKLGLAVALRP